MADDVAHQYEVKCRLTAEEYLAFRALADSKGLNQASLIRMQIKEAIAKHCAAQVEPLIEPERDRSGTADIHPSWPMMVGDR